MRRTKTLDKILDVLALVTLICMVIIVIGAAGLVLVSVPATALKFGGLLFAVALISWSIVRLVDRENS